jgi:hypothetical protein
MAVRTRAATGKIPWPLILLGGPEKGGKSHLAATFCSSKRVGLRFWLDLNEGAADEYVSLSIREPGDEGYQIIDHDGTFSDIYDQVLEVDKVARNADANGEPPVVLVVDSASALWKMFTAWANTRALRTKKNQRLLAEDPDNQIDVPYYVWNEPNKRHRRFMDTLMQMPAIVIMTGRLAEKAIIEKGEPRRDGAKEWKIEVQKDVVYDATAVIHIYREKNTRRFTLAGVRSLHFPQPDGAEIELSTGTLDLEAFIWDGLKCSQENSGGRVMAPLVADRAETWIEDVNRETDEEALRAVWAMLHDKAGLPPGEDRERVKASITSRVEFLRSLPTEDAPMPEEPPEDDTSARIRAAANQNQEETA